jgi:hypothetical protein
MLIWCCRQLGYNFNFFQLLKLEMTNHISQLLPSNLKLSKTFCLFFNMCIQDSKIVYLVFSWMSVDQCEWLFKLWRHGKDKNHIKIWDSTWWRWFCWRLCLHGKGDFVENDVGHSTNVATLLWECVRMRFTLPKWGLASLSGLPKVQSSIARVKTPQIGAFFISLESYWSVDVQNGLAWPIWTFATQVMAKRKAGSQTGNSTPDHGKSGIDLGKSGIDSTKATTLI